MTIPQKTLHPGMPFLNGGRITKPHCAGPRFFDSQARQPQYLRRSVVS